MGALSSLKTTLRPAFRNSVMKSVSLIRSRCFISTLARKELVVSCWEIIQQELQLHNIFDAVWHTCKISSQCYSIFSLLKGPYRSSEAFKHHTLPQQVRVFYLQPIKKLLISILWGDPELGLVARCVSQLLSFDLKPNIVHHLGCKLILTKYISK